MATRDIADSTYNFWNRYRNIYGEPWREVQGVLGAYDGTIPTNYGWTASNGTPVTTTAPVTTTPVQATEEPYMRYAYSPTTSGEQITSATNAYTPMDFWLDEQKLNQKPGETPNLPTLNVGESGESNPYVLAIKSQQQNNGNTLSSSSIPSYSSSVGNATSGALDELNAYNLANIGYLIKPMSDYSEQDMKSAQGALSSGLSGSEIGDVGKWKLRDSEKIARMQLGQQMLEPYLQRQQGIDLAKIGANADTYRQVLAGEQAMQQLKLQESGLLQRQTQKEKADLEQQVLIGKQAMEQLKLKGEYENAIALLNANVGIQKQIMDNANQTQIANLNNQGANYRANVANPLATPSQSKAISDVVNKYTGTVNPYSNTSINQINTTNTNGSSQFYTQPASNPIANTVENLYPTGTGIGMYLNTEPYSNGTNQTNATYPAQDANYSDWGDWYGNSGYGW